MRAPDDTIFPTSRPGNTDWPAAILVPLVHLAAAFAIVHLVVAGVSPWSVGLGVLWLLCTGLSITAGYHRLFAHPTYKAHALLRAFHLLFGAASVQGSALRWAADHRQHHAQVDDEHEDPYSIRNGFFWAHIGWIFVKRRNGNTIDHRLVRDLERDPLVRYQHRYIVFLAVLVALAVPAALGLCWGDPIGAMLLAGPLRLVLQWHATWAVNSMAHTVGTQPYATTSSARDSVWTALVTFGEGYHNYHHRFQADYRNGVRWYHYDPTKWFVWTLASLRLASDLRRVPAERIERARQQVLAEAEARATTGP